MLYTYLHAYIYTHIHSELCWQLGFCISASPRRTMLYSGFLSTTPPAWPQTITFQAAPGFLCCPSNFLLRNSLLSINLHLPYNTLFLQRYLADCLWPHFYPTPPCKLKPMFKRACADEVSVSIYPNSWAVGHSHAVGNLVKRQEQVGVCTVEMVVPAGLLD